MAWFILSTCILNKIFLQSALLLLLVWVVSPMIGSFARLLGGFELGIIGYWVSEGIAYILVINSTEFDILIRSIRAKLTASCRTRRHSNVCSDAFPGVK